MDGKPNHIDALRDAYIAAYAVGALPIWVFSADGSRLLFANAVGAAIFGSDDVGSITGTQLDATHAAAGQIARLTFTLKYGGRPSLERLRGFGAGMGRPLLCACSRIQFLGQSAILIAAQEPAGPNFPFVTRVRRLIVNSDVALAAFADDGRLIEATAKAAPLLDSQTTISGLKADGISVEKIGTDKSWFQLVRWPATPAKAAGETSIQPQIPAGSQDACEPAETVSPTFISEPPVTVIIAENNTPPESVCDTTSESGGVTEEPAAPNDDLCDLSTEAHVSSGANAEHEDTSDQLPETDEAHREPTASAPSTSAPDESGQKSETPSTIAAAGMPVESVGITPPDQPEAPALDAAETIPMRRHPLRFVWQMDVEQRFSLDAGEFSEIIGAPNAPVSPRPWGLFAAELSLDPDGEVDRAIATRDTWSGITVQWPVSGTAETLAVELSGLPVFDRERRFRGYRGFGVCRDLKAIHAIAIRQAAAQSQPSEMDIIHGATPPAADPIQPSSQNSLHPGPAPTARPSSDTVSEADAENVVPFRPAGDTRSPTLNTVERNAFRELATQLTARLKDADEAAAARNLDSDAAQSPAPAQPLLSQAAPAQNSSQPSQQPEQEQEQPETSFDSERPILDKLPVGILIYRNKDYLYANHTFLDWTAHVSLTEFSDAGGLDTLFIDTHEQDNHANGATRVLRIARANGETMPLDARLLTIPWQGATAMLLVFMPSSRHAAAVQTLHESDDVRALLDIVADGVLITDRQGRILMASTGAEKLFGYGSSELPGRILFDLLAPEGARIARDGIEALSRPGAPRMLSEGRDVAARLRVGGVVPLFLTMGRLPAGTTFCVALRDISRLKKAEGDLAAAQQATAQSNAERSEFLDGISHNIRSPLNDIIGLSDVMMNERLGPLGSDRYRDHLKDIHGAGERVLALIDDLLGLTKIETGALNLEFAPVDLNAIVQQAVAEKQLQANQDRVIMRSALAPHLPHIIGDAKSVRQIVQNVLANALKFSGAAGQVIVSTAFVDRSQAILRVRDTGTGMSQDNAERMLEPLRQIATSARMQDGGKDLGLPLAKALAEANHATFSIKSAAEAGTLVEIIFPAAAKTS